MLVTLSGITRLRRDSQYGDACVPQCVNAVRNNKTDQRFAAMKCIPKYVRTLSGIIFNASSPSGITKLFKDSQSAPATMLVMLSGITISVKERQLRKCPSPYASNTIGNNKTMQRFATIKCPSPMRVTLSGITRLRRDLQYTNATANVVTLLGITRLLKDSQYSNAQS